MGVVWQRGAGCRCVCASVTRADGETREETSTSTGGVVQGVGRGVFAELRQGERVGFARAAERPLFWPRRLNRELA